MNKFGQIIFLLYTLLVLSSTVWANVEANRAAHERMIRDYYHHVILPNQQNDATPAAAPATPPPPSRKRPWSMLFYDVETGAWGLSNDYTTSDAASGDADRRCMAGGGKKCDKLLSDMAGSCAVIYKKDAVTYRAGGNMTLRPADISQAYGTDPLVLLQGAMQACYALEHSSGARGARQCTLLTLPICHHSIANAKTINQMAANATVKDLIDITLQYDKRRYVGALLMDQARFVVSYDQQNEQDAKETALDLALSGNLPVIGYYENTCLAWAKPSAKAKQTPQFIKTATDDNPVIAKQKAQAQCSKQYGACQTEVQCSGRRYNNNPNALERE